VNILSPNKWANSRKKFYELIFVSEMEVYVPKEKEDAAARPITIPIRYMPIIPEMVSSKWR